jgi:hypothetical protein
MTMRTLGFSLLALGLLHACAADDSSPPEGMEFETSGSTGGTSTLDGPQTDDGATDGATAAQTETDGGTGEPVDDAQLELVQRLGGLWVAPVTSWSSAGSFPTMNMDMRPADDRVLFSRVDLDADNALRFAFSHEVHDGQSVLVFRNGGLFQGVVRDTRTRLVEHDPDAETWRFCAIAGGCMYVDAVFDFQGDDAFTLEVKVLGMDHVRWSPTRREDRDAAPLADAEPNDADAPFPDMPSARLELTWTEPLEHETEAWVILTTTDCGFAPGSCTPSRFMRTIAPAGATQAQLVLDQLHSGAYKVNAVLDRNGNLASTLFPDSGDTVSLPNRSLDVAPQGETTATFAITIDL